MNYISSNVMLDEVLPGNKLQKELVVELQLLIHRYDFLARLFVFDSLSVAELRLFSIYLRLLS